ncbi:MAG: divergent polysaccharide deacetylase family protein [Vulcanimicrobiaceae bacterium]
MRNWFWGALIVLSLGVIVAGYLGGSRATPPPTASLRRSHATHSSDAAGAPVRDLFSNDDVVVERPQMAGLSWQPERLGIVIGLCGQSIAVESGFLGLGVPLSFDLDPHAAQAQGFAADVRAAGERLFIHVGHPPTGPQLTALRRRFGRFDGVASRESAGMAQALAGRSLAFFDERGDADARLFQTAGVPLEQRDVTADDRAAPAYIGYMLRRAAERSAYEGRVVVLMRPMLESLSALARFLHGHNAEIVDLR